MNIITHPDIETVFDNYPDTVRSQMRALRQLVIDTAAEIPEIDSVEVTLKWREPSFITKQGCTLRMDWKAKKPDQYAMYFKCTSRLVETFKLAFGDLFNYENNRAILFQLDQEVPVAELKQCIKTTLLYHQGKSDPMLGI